MYPIGRVHVYLAPKRGAAALYALLAVAGGPASAGCGDRNADVPTVVQRPHEPRDGGTPELDAAYVRPASPRLPDADEDLVLPFGGEATFELEVQADLGRMDVHFSVDTTSSIAGEINHLQDSLDDDIIPRLRRRVEDVAFGVSRFEDFPVAPFGATFGEGGGGRVRADTPFDLLTPITTDRTRLRRALSDLDDPLGFGGDAAEAGAEALYQIATGEGYRKDGRNYVEPFDSHAERAAGDIGGVGFREGALPVIVHITDAPTHAENEPDEWHSHTLDDAIEALKGISAHVIGIASGGCSTCGFDLDGSRARSYLLRAAFETGATMPLSGTDCPTGVEGSPLPPFRDTCPLVFEVDQEGEGLSSTVSDAIAALLDGIRFRMVDAGPSDDPLGFVQAVEARVIDLGGAEPELVDVQPVEAPDGIPDTVLNVGNRTTIGYTIHLRNRVIAPSDRDQRFRVVVTVRGDGLVVSEIVLRVVVPAGARDAGMSVESDDDAG